MFVGGSFSGQVPKSTLFMVQFKYFDFDFSLLNLSSTSSSYINVVPVFSFAIDQSHIYDT